MTDRRAGQSNWLGRSVSKALHHGDGDSIMVNQSCIGQVRDLSPHSAVSNGCSVRRTRDSPALPSAERRRRLCPGGRPGTARCGSARRSLRPRQSQVMPLPLTALAISPRRTEHARPRCQRWQQGRRLHHASSPVATPGDGDAHGGARGGALRQCLMRGRARPRPGVRGAGSSRGRALIHVRAVSARSR